MSKQVYISADYDEDAGDRDVVDTLNKWGSDNFHKVDFIDMSKVASGSISNNSDCRICDLKKEFNQQINASSAVVAIVGDKTSSRTAGNSCERMGKGASCTCTPYKQNINGIKTCRYYSTSAPGPNDDLGNINSYSYLKHEFIQAKKKGKTIIVLYNSLYKQPNWLPTYMKDYESNAHPFWIKNVLGEKVGDYSYIKKALGYE